MTSPPRKVKLQPKQYNNNDGEVNQVEQGGGMAGVQDSKKELSNLICSIMREEINLVVKKRNTIMDDISACMKRLGEVDENLSEMDSRIIKLKAEFARLDISKAELTEKVERLEMQSRKHNLRVFGFPDDI